VSYPGTRSVPAVDVESAARLVAHGMRPKALPARDPAYADLVRRYREDDVFADTVQRIASGLGLVVLAVGPASGLVLAAVEDSAFEIRMDEYARRTVLANRQADKVMHGLAHLAVAALAFPRADDLADDTYVVDLAWLRSTPWRERIAAAFDSPRRRPDLTKISAVTVRHREDSLASGLLFCGWPASRLGWEPG
jgi:hypothetical protein